MHRIAPLPRLTASETRALNTLYQTVCPMAGDYYAKRLRAGLYDSVVYAADGSDVFAAQLLNDFVCGQRRHVYLGPLVSTRHLYFGMIAYLLRELHEASGERPITIMAEVQNPLIAVMLAYAFGDACSAGLDAGIPSLPDRAVVRTFSRRLPHIEAIDWRTMTTRGRSSLFRPRAIYAPIVARYKARGVDFAAGQSLIALIRLCAGQAARAEQLCVIMGRAGALLGATPAAAVHDALTWFQSHCEQQSHQTEESLRVHR